DRSEGGRGYRQARIEPAQPAAPETVARECSARRFAACALRSAAPRLAEPECPGGPRRPPGALRSTGDPDRRPGRRCSVCHLALPARTPLPPVRGDRCVRLARFRGGPPAPQSGRTGLRGERGGGLRGELQTYLRFRAAAARRAAGAVRECDAADR